MQFFLAFGPVISQQALGGDCFLGTSMEVWPQQEKVLFAIFSGCRSGWNEKCSRSGEPS